ncbi:MAG TPA: response regulator, partial [Lysobacter sp.]|nr:response regulator [Lysobacter sp.]
AEGLRVLVVDDNRDAATSMGLLLDVMGLDNRVAFDGASALDVAGAFLPDVALLDIGMPGMDGYALARELRADPRHRDLLIVALTGWGGEADRQRTRDAGFDEHLSKPVDVHALRTLLHEMQGRRRAAA